MAKRWKDDLGDSWEVELFLEGDDDPDTGEPLEDRHLLTFGADERSLKIFVRGDLEELRQLGGQLELAMEAAKDARGFLFFDEAGGLWWVRKPAEDALDDAGYPITFSNSDEDRRHPGPLRAPADELEDDELQDLLDAARDIATKPGR